MDVKQFRGPGLFPAGGEINLQGMKGFAGGVGIQQLLEACGQQLPQVNVIGGGAESGVDSVVLIIIAPVLGMQNAAQLQGRPGLTKRPMSGLGQAAEGIADSGVYGGT